MDDSDAAAERAVAYLKAYIADAQFYPLPKGIMEFNIFPLPRMRLCVDKDSEGRVSINQREVAPETPDLVRLFPLTLPELGNVRLNFALYEGVAFYSMPARDNQEAAQALEVFRREVERMEAHHLTGTESIKRGAWPVDRNGKMPSGRIV